MKKGIRGHDVVASGLNSICQKCLDNGIEYLQLVLEKSVQNFKYGIFSEEYANTLKKELGSLKLAVLGSYINPSNPDEEALRQDIAKFKEKIKYASILNPIVVGTETGIYKEGETDSEEAYQRVLLTIKELTSEAEKYGVCIGVEMVGCFVINSPKKLKRLIDDIGSDNVKAIFDPVNILNIDNYKNQDEIINETFDLLRDRICTVHAKDFCIENGEFKMVKPTEGLLNYRLIFEKLKEHNLDVPIICEEITDDDAKKAFKRLTAIRQDVLK